MAILQTSPEDILGALQKLEQLTEPATNDFGGNPIESFHAVDKTAFEHWMALQAAIQTVSNKATRAMREHVEAATEHMLQHVEAACGTYHVEYAAVMASWLTSIKTPTQEDQAIERRTSKVLGILGIYHWAQSMREKVQCALEGSGQSSKVSSRFRSSKSNGHTQQ